MSEETRRSGIEIVGDVPWGTHFCQFYQTGEDLLDILVPYFKAGLEDNEFCMWVTSQPVTAEDAEAALRQAMPGVERYLESGQLEIIPYSDWYTKGGSFDSDRVLAGWVDKLESALAKGYQGLRLTGNTFWLEKSDWQGFTDYERAVDNVIGSYHMLAVCTYQADKCGVAEVADVISNHQFALIKRQSGWEIIESAGRKRMAEALIESGAKYRLLFENMPDAAAYHRVLYDENDCAVDYVFLEANDAFEKQTGLKRQNILARRVTEVIPGIEKSGFDWIGTYGRIAKTREAIRFEQHSEHLGRWYSVSSYAPVEDHFVAIFIDVTEQIQSRQRIEELAAEAQRQAADARQRAAELDAANKELESFSYSVSHDLRAPLRAINGFSHAVLEDYGDKLAGQGKEYLQSVIQESQRMAQLIDDMLTLSRIARTQLRRERVDLGRLAQVVVSGLHVTDPERKVEFAIAPGLVANCDGRLLRVALENLLDNAWKFTSKHRTARIEFGVTQQDGNPVFFVRDDGAGFEMAYSSKLFGAFQRLHAEREFAGTGIGLATVQRIIQRHGGRIWAESQVEQGATFYFTLSS